VPGEVLCMAMSPEPDLVASTKSSSGSDKSNSLPRTDDQPLVLPTVVSAAAIHTSLPIPLPPSFPVSNTPYPHSVPIPDSGTPTSHQHSSYSVSPLSPHPSITPSADSIVMPPPPVPPVPHTQPPHLGIDPPQLLATHMPLATTRALSQSSESGVVLNPGVGVRLQTGEGTAQNMGLGSGSAPPAYAINHLPGNGAAPTAPPRRNRRKNRTNTDDDNVSLASSASVSSLPSPSLTSMAMSSAADVISIGHSLDLRQAVRGDYLVKPQDTETSKALGPSAEEIQEMARLESEDTGSQASTPEVSRAPSRLDGSSTTAGTQTTRVTNTPTS
ncbi:unnamed protein product, partial [Meganyctiphanes norvegica]